MTKTAGGQWKLASGTRPFPTAKLRPYAPTGNADNVKAVRFVMLETNGNPQFMDVLEAGVRGGAAGRRLRRATRIARAARGTGGV
jgi:hypothetical protein